MARRFRAIGSTKDDSTWANAPRAESWCTLDGQPKALKKPRKKRARRKSQKPRQREPRNLPAPVDLTPSASPEPAQPVTLASRVANLFSTQAAAPATQSESSSATYGDGEPLSAESQNLLASVPDSIGGTSEPGEADGASLPDPQDPIAALMAQVAFEEQDVKDTLGELFDWLAERFESDHWRLTDRQTRMLGRPAAQMLNSVWAKLQVYIPDILGKWCEDTPGATALLMACGIVIVPKVAKQVAISRTRRKSVPMVQQGASHVAPVAAPPPQPAAAPASSMIWAQEDAA